MDVDDFDPVEVARKAVELMGDRATVWLIEDLSTGEICCVDSRDGRIIYTEGL